MNTLFKDTGLFDMRAATYREENVYCPNASILGHQHYMAKRGDLVSYTYGEESERECLGRVIGRVDAPASGKEPAIKGHIAVLELGMTASTGFVRWIDPKWVTAIRTIPSTAFIEWFFGQGFLDNKLETVLRHSKFGSLNDRSLAERPYQKDNGELIEDPREAWRKG